MFQGQTPGQSWGQTWGQTPGQRWGQTLILKVLWEGVVSVL